MPILGGMKRIIPIMLLCFAAVVAAAQGRNFEVRGSQGRISLELTLPDGFDPESGSCPLVILMHGIFSSKDFTPMPALARALAEAGIASIRFDFGGHGRSEGTKQAMTIEREIAEAMAVWEYARALPYVSGIGLLGHSQGGVVASMTAGRLAAQGAADPVKGPGVPVGLVLIAPGSVIKEACQSGKFFNARFDPADPPEFIRCWGMYKLGREYLVSTQTLDIFGTSAAYKGPVCILHGTKDKIVPLWCSERYKETYGDSATLTLIEGGNHMITIRKAEFVKLAVEFFKGSCL